MSTALYYDTCVFGHHLNPTHPESESCTLLLDVSKIKWTVYFGEVSRVELKIGEYIDAFETQCALHGISVACVPLKTADATAKQHRGLKKRLTLLGFRGPDWKHLMGAVSAAVQYLLTADRDYWSPAAKATRKSKTVPQDVLRLIRDETGVRVSLPSIFVSSLSVDSKDEEV